MKPAHTPGPWHVGTKEAHHCVYDAHGWQIADASPLGKDGNTKFNAQLIAEAPNLLAVAERIAGILEPEEWNSDTLGQLAEVQQWLDATVAQAKGEAR